MLSLSTTREAERRQALGCSRHPCCGRATHEARARPRADQLTQSARRGTLASRRSTAAVFWPRARQGEAFGRWPDAAGVLKASAGAFARSARSGGRAVSLGRLPGARLRAAHAGRRIPLRLWLVSGDALGERDVHEDRWTQASVNLFRCNGHKSGDSGGGKCEFARCHRKKLCQGYPQCRPQPHARGAFRPRDRFNAPGFRAGNCVIGKSLRICAASSSQKSCA